ncbi:uncharacterized protein STEHIDRAFT_156802 [Stereum hirsutum FP-91666 SS1]|uniref:uncharacterized protein n=1 Tax=Stereum hirsutum (strain FP-91666) TaxID=721885 RepID=UPI000440A410|nr:uncharacterized protein STEHIDRAFT_156802 [Stereum hirsutum FP-91666 SS1]EIM86495.1 hypothetical protein STEHIDRAFT_156802 [Stereum hirsutum FP-91666 SS1]
MSPARCGLIHIPSYATEVTDADEEVFLLYTRLASIHPVDGESKEPFRGLGYLDGKSDTLTVRLELKPPTAEPPTSNTFTPTGKKSGRNKSRSAHGKAKKENDDGTKVIEVELAQDRTALRSRSGDTGSVLWRASIDFARFVLQQYHFPVSDGLFDPPDLDNAHILELGAGTGLFSLLIGTLVRRYTATDIPALVPLLQKNIPHQPPSSSSLHSHSHGHSQTPTRPHSISAAALDWTLPVHRQLPDPVLQDTPDILLAVDCIYHPSLIPPLLKTIEELSTKDRTAVVIVCELRAEDVVREFLEGWLNLSTGKGGEVGSKWRIWSLSDVEESQWNEDGGRGLGPRYGMWVGWKV